MRMMFDVTDPDQRKQTMTEKKSRSAVIDVEAPLAHRYLDMDYLRELKKETLRNAA